MVDWSYIEKQLHGIPVDFKSQKFNSLKRVIEILSSANPHLALNELKTELVKCERMIDSVVDSYHLGFNHAIQNYSKILKLFNESQIEVRNLKASLEEARLRLGTHSSNLRSHWHTAVSLKDSISILEDVRGVVENQAALVATITKKDWLQASVVLLRLANRLAIDDLQRLGALSQIRLDLMTHWHTIVSSLVSDILELVFHRPAAMTAPAKVDATGPSAQPATAGGANAPGASSQPTLLSHHPRIAAIMHQLESARAAAAASGPSDALDEGPLREAMVQQVGDVRMQQLLDGVIRLDSVHVLRSSLSAALAPQLRKVMEKAIHNASAHAGEAPPQEGRPQRYFVAGNVHASVQRCTAHALSHVLLVLRHLGVLFELLSTAGDDLVTARRHGGQGMSLLRGLAYDRSIGATDSHYDAHIVTYDDSAEPSSPMTMPEISKSASEDRDALWLTVQEELLSFVAVVIRAPKAKSQSKDELELDLDSDGRSTWLSGLLKGELAFASSKRKSKLAFQFESDSNDNSDSLQNPAIHKTEEDVSDYSSLISVMTLGSTPSVFLTPAVYAALSHFCADAATALRLGPTADRRLQAQRNMLMAFMDDFVAETVLFKVWMDAKTQVVQRLADKFAFKIAEQRSVRRDSRTGRPVLQAVLAVEALLEELAMWSKAMPLYVEPLSSIAMNMLLRLIDEADQVSASLVTSTTLRGLVTAPPTALLMLRQPAALHLADPLLFQAAKLDAGECAEFEAAHGGALGEGRHDEAEELFMTYLSMRPIMTEELMQGSGNLQAGVNVAALANSCLYLVEAMQSHGPSLSMSAAARDGEKEAGDKASLWSAWKGSGRSTVLPAAAAAPFQPKAAASMAPAMQHILVRLKCQAGACIRMLKLDLELYVVSRVSELRRCRKLVSEDSLRDFDTSMSLLVRHIQRVDEQLSPYLSPEVVHYLLDDLPALCCKLLVSILPELEEVNRVGLDRTIRWMSVVKASIASAGEQLSARSAAFIVTDAWQQQQFDVAVSFCGLLKEPVGNILADAQSDFVKFSVREWRSLLDVQVTGRVVTQAHRQALDGIIDSEKRRSADVQAGGASPTNAVSTMSSWLPHRTKSNFP